MAERSSARNRAGSSAIRRHVEGVAPAAGIREVPARSSIAAIKGSDNIIAFTTKRYSRTPLVVQFRGRARMFTAMCVFSDILKLLTYATALKKKKKLGAGTISYTFQFIG